jgi:hypothetical protein
MASETKSTDQTQKLSELVNSKNSEMTKEKEIGWGKHGKVYSGTYDGNPVAIKKYSDCGDEIVNHPKDFPNQHIENVVDIVGYGEENGSLIVATELCENKKLCEFLSDEKNLNLPLNDRIKIAIGILNGIKNIQKKYPEKKFTNISSANVYVTKSLDAKIKSPHMCNIHKKNAFGTSTGADANFSAPEEFEELKIIDAKTYEQIMVYRYGGMLYHLITYKIPFHDARNDFEIIKNISLGRIPLCKPNVETNKEEFSKLVALVGECWSLDPSERPTLEYIQNVLDEITKKII